MVTGKAPERVTREPSHEAPAAPKDRRDLYKKVEAQASKGELREEKVDPSLARIGVVGTYTFHRPDCEALKGVPTSDQIRFTSPWDGLDGGYRPCEKCQPMR